MVQVRQTANFHLSFCEKGSAHFQPAVHFWPPRGPMFHVVVRGIWIERATLPFFCLLHLWRLGLSLQHSCFLRGTLGALWTSATGVGNQMAEWFHGIDAWSSGGCVCVFWTGRSSVQQESNEAHVEMFEFKNGGAIEVFVGTKVTKEMFYLFCFCCCCCCWFSFCFCLLLFFVFVFCFNFYGCLSLWMELPTAPSNVECFPVFPPPASWI